MVKVSHALNHSATEATQKCHKNAFWNELEAVIMKVPHKEKLVPAGDLNGHVGESQIGFERWNGGFSVEERNEEGENILHLTQAFDLAIVNTFYSKRREDLLTYKSGRKDAVNGGEGCQEKDGSKRKN